jgi:pSer/pThr/pTyr-binding forkhead associated (FHA) protein
LQPPRAFVILEGERTITLSQSVLNVGRRFDSDIILDDPRVSRAHAQLRLRFGHYVVYDLGSTGGTFVNGQRVGECVLRPGDVISLGGVPIIYGEDSAGERLPRGDTKGATRALPGHTAPLERPRDGEPPTRP